VIIARKSIGPCRCLIVIWRGTGGDVRAEIAWQPLLLPIQFSFFFGHFFTKRHVFTIQ
jgi:hypothetical protein